MILSFKCIKLYSFLFAIRQTVFCFYELHQQLHLVILHVNYDHMILHLLNLNTFSPRFFFSLFEFANIFIIINQQKRWEQTRKTERARKFSTKEITWSTRLFSKEIKFSFFSILGFCVKRVIYALIQKKKGKSFTRKII